MDFIDLKTQYTRIEAPLATAMKRVLETGAYVLGPEVVELESRLADYCGVKHCISMSSGTDALLAALMALDVGHGDEVITSPFSFIASAETIRLLGAVPTFVDIDPATYNLDPSLLARAITDRTKAIMPVSLYGQCADMTAINDIAAAAGLQVIEDAAQSFGARQQGRVSCAMSTIACTSFYPAKPLGCYGDGGACFTDDEQLAGVLRQLRDHGQEGRYHHTRVGLNARLDTLQAVVLLEKLAIFDDEIAARRAAADEYNRLITARELPLVTPYIAAGNLSVYAQYTLRSAERDAVREALGNAGIPTAVHYPKPIHLQPAFESVDYVNGSFVEAERAAEEVFSLPMHPYLDEADLARVVDALAAALPSGKVLSAK